MNPEYTVRHTPTCRYCSGEVLTRVEPPPANEKEYKPPFFVIYAMAITHTGARSLPGPGFSVDVFRCAKCGYIELHDDRIIHE